MVNTKIYITANRRKREERIILRMQTLIVCSRIGKEIDSIELPYRNFVKGICFENETKVRIKNCDIAFFVCLSKMDKILKGEIKQFFNQKKNIIGVIKNSVSSKYIENLCVLTSTKMNYNRYSDEKSLLSGFTLIYKKETNLIRKISLLAAALMRIVE